MKRAARAGFGIVLSLIELYFGDQAMEVVRLPFSTLALRDLLNAALMALMAAIFAAWAWFTARGKRTSPK